MRLHVRVWELQDVEAPEKAEAGGLAGPGSCQWSDVAMCCTKRLRLEKQNPINPHFARVLFG